MFTLDMFAFDNFTYQACRYHSDDGPASNILKNAIDILVKL